MFAVHFAYNVIPFNGIVVNVYAFSHSASVYHPPNVYPATTGAVGAVTVVLYACVIASGAVQCPFALNVIVYSFAVHVHLNSTAVAGIVNFPSLTVIHAAFHESENVYPANVGNADTVTSAPYLYDTVAGTDGAHSIAGSFVYT